MLFCLSPFSYTYFKADEVLNGYGLKNVNWRDVQETVQKYLRNTPEVLRNNAMNNTTKHVKIILEIRLILTIVIAE